MGEIRDKERLNDGRYRERSKKRVVINKRGSGMGGKNRTEDDGSNQAEMSVDNDIDCGVTAYAIYSLGNCVENLRKTCKSSVKIGGNQACPGQKFGTLPLL
jgi:hypothetical protein